MPMCESGKILKDLGHIFRSPFEVWAGWDDSLRFNEMLGICCLIWLGTLDGPRQALTTTS